MFRTKICGIRLISDVQAVERSGGDAVGLNFFPPSVRYLDPETDQASELAAACHDAGLLSVGVFVNEPVNRMTAIAHRLGLAAIQLHGDEPVSVGDQLVSEGYRLIRAIKLPKTPFEPSLLNSRASAWTALGAHLILDADGGVKHGGSGKTLDWPSVCRWADQIQGGRQADLIGDVTWTLAGGLKPENIAAAIVSSGAVSVDTASGVECPKGVKNAQRISAFVDAANRAFQRDDDSEC